MCLICDMGSQEISSHRETLSSAETKDPRDTKRSTRALSRWRILARALAGSPEPISGSSESDEEVSVRRFTSFGLLKCALLVNTLADGGPPGGWCEYSVRLDGRPYNVQIRRVSKCFTANELIGFNNTGNVCVWPSEECLAYYLLRNRGLCRNRNVLELGGGMSCLAGVLAAKYCNPSSVTLTDGNVTSVDNVRRIVARNDMQHLAGCGVVQWARAARVLRQRRTTAVNGNHRRVKTRTAGDEDEDEDARLPSGLYDVILSADCLFFDDARLDLVETIYGWLADDGVALVMAPRRGTTFQKFAEASIRRGFIARQTERYDDTVWSRHLELLANSPEYCPDLHYPVLLELTKQKKTPPG
ncbi:calmodulin-lysine N-methyltransferase [Monomorium pharaonis]|uniref:calmodulin-lysine N-methyltransferase n=1 Tax=Monomorium pharaonis TaxID=307658 RepID=UPI00063EF704|nr:calmodulin-lysine N-methyltransferase [Monomorium pharaonis]